jgi:hypothetical protein
MNDKKLEKIQKILELADTDYASVEEVAEIFNIFKKAVADLKTTVELAKSEMGEMVGEHKSKVDGEVDEKLTKIEKLLTSTVSKERSLLTEEVQDLREDLLKQVTQIRTAISAIPAPEKVDQEAIISEAVTKAKNEIQPLITPDVSKEMRQEFSTIKETIEAIEEKLEKIKKEPNRVVGANRNLHQLLDVNVSGITTDQSIKWDGTKWIPYTPGAGGGGTSFLDLEDTPDSYTGSAGYIVKVNAGETALIFEELSGGGHTIQEEGSDLTQRTNLNFISTNLTAADDAGNDATTVTLSDTPQFSGVGAGKAASTAAGYTALLNSTRNKGFWVEADQATQRFPFGFYVTGDAQLRFTANAGGEIGWGDGTSTTDTNLYRSAANLLKTDDSLSVVGNIGIGTDSISGRLHLKGTVTQSVYIEATGNENSANIHLLSKTAGGTAHDWQLGTNASASDNDFEIYSITGGGSRFKLTTGGTFFLPAYTTNGFVKTTGSDGEFTIDTSTYLTSVGTGVTNELTYWSGTNTLGSLATATYPSLTELSYVKGVTSAIQTQFASYLPLAGGTMTGRILLRAGTTTAGTSPIKFQSGTSMTNAEAGATEFTTDDLFFTITTGTARKRLLMADPVGGLTSGRVPYNTTNGRLTDTANLTFDATTLTLTGLLRVTGSSATTTTEIIKMAASQSADALKVQDSSAYDVARVDANGTVYSGGVGQSSLVKGLVVNSGQGNASTDEFEVWGAVNKLIESDPSGEQVKFYKINAVGVDDQIVMYNDDVVFY